MALLLLPCCFRQQDSLQYALVYIVIRSLLWKEDFMLQAAGITASNPTHGLLEAASSISSAHGAARASRLDARHTSFPGPA